MILLARAGRGTALMPSGETYFLAVEVSMEGLRGAADELRSVKPGLTIGCTLEVSGLLLPVFSRLKRALGDSVAVRVVTYDFDVLPLLVPAGLDFVFESTTTGSPDRAAVKVMDEEIVPVASPALIERFGWSMLAGHPRHWAGVPRLDIGPRSPGWATWDSWFDAQGCAPPDASVETFENYIHLLRAAADGDGIAIRWNGFMTDYFEFGRLVAVRDAWLPTKLATYGVPTRSGRKNRATRACLQHLRSLVGGLCSERRSRRSDAGVAARIKAAV